MYIHPVHLVQIALSFARAGARPFIFSIPATNRMTHPIRSMKYSPEARVILYCGGKIYDFATCWHGARIHFPSRESITIRGNILLRSQQHPNPRGDDHERIALARQVVIALVCIEDCWSANQSGLERPSI